MFVLAPMADVTDAAFRRMIAKYSAHVRPDGTVGGADVTWTEFVAADGLVKATPEGKKLLLENLIYSEKERPIVAQLFSSNKEHIEQAAKLCRELGFDGVDINMGCPDRSIEKQGAGAAMIKNPENAIEVIKAAKRGAKMGEKEGIPVSVKTRVGYNKEEVETWLLTILKEEPAALIVHARTRKEMSRTKAHWNLIKKVVEIRDRLKIKTLIIGNGDVLSIKDAQKKIDETGADGAMLGRAVFGNPWLFNPQKDISDVSIEERLKVMCEHTRLFVKIFPLKNFSVMKKHYKAYVNSFKGAAELRARLMKKNNPREIEEVVRDFLSKRNFS